MGESPLIGLGMGVKAVIVIVVPRRAALTANGNATNIRRHAL